MTPMSSLIEPIFVTFSHVVFIRTHGVLFCSPCKLYAFFHALTYGYFADCVQIINCEHIHAVQYNEHLLYVQYFVCTQCSL